jgi:hypothetical protein
MTTQSYAIFLQLKLPNVWPSGGHHTATSALYMFMACLATVLELTFIKYKFVIQTVTKKYVEFLNFLEDFIIIIKMFSYCV